MSGIVRRGRFDRPQPRRIDEFEYSDADDLLLLKLDWHGTVATPILYEFTKHLRGVYKFHQKRLTDLFNGWCDHIEHRTLKRETGEPFPVDEHGNQLWKHACQPQALIARNPKLWHTIHAKYQPEAYHLTTLGKKRLDALGAGTIKHFRRSNSAAHDLALGCFTASFDLQANLFVFREQLLVHANCPETTRQEDAPFYFALDPEHYYPDDIFGNQYEPGKFRFFSLDFDMGTESKEKTRKKITALNEVFRTAAYRRLGLPNLTVLYPTVNVAKREFILECVRELVDPEFRTRFLTKVYDTFAVPWRIPSAPLETMTDWHSVIGLQDISKKAP